MFYFANRKNKSIQIYACPALDFPKDGYDAVICTAAPLHCCKLNLSLLLHARRVFNSSSLTVQLNNVSVDKAWVGNAGSAATSIG